METMMDDEIKISLEAAAEKWMEIAIQKFQESLTKYKVRATDALYNSFVGELKKNGGDVDKVILKFLQYGRFRDMGVGRGMKIGDAKNQGKKSRKPAKWYSKTLFHETVRFKEIIRKEFSIQAMAQIESKLGDNNTTINL